MNNRRNSLFGKKVVVGPWGWGKIGEVSVQKTDVTVFYYVFGILVHCVTAHNVSYDTAVEMGYKK
jgi:hypothetical protein